ncbi:MAG: hypothetical protein ACR2MQ_05190 [Gemmatimonadaceae bacterium]
MVPIMRRYVSVTGGVLLVLAPNVVGAQNGVIQTEAVNRQQISGVVWAVLPSGAVLTGSKADIYVWADNSTSKAMFDSACKASTDDKTAWLTARAELTDPTTGSSGSTVEDRDIRLLRSLTQLPHATAQADSTGHFAVADIPNGSY